MYLKNVLVILKFTLLNSFLFIQISAFDNSDFVRDKVDNSKRVDDMKALLNKHGENVLNTSLPDRKKPLQDDYNFSFTQPRFKAIRHLKYSMSPSIKYSYSRSSTLPQLSSYTRSRYYPRRFAREQFSLSAGQKYITPDINSISIIPYSNVNKLSKLTTTFLNSDSATEYQNLHLIRGRSLNATKVSSPLLQIFLNSKSDHHHKLEAPSQLTNKKISSQKTALNLSKSKKKAKIEKRATTNSLKIKDLIPPQERLNELAQINLNSIIAILKTVPGKIFLFKSFMAT